MRWDFVVFGSTGMQGKIVSRDLLENGYSVLMCGRDKKRVEHLLKKYKKNSFEYADVRDINNTAKIIKKSGAKVVVNCVEGDWNLHVLKACVKAKAHCLDLGSEIWMTKKQFKMHSKLKKMGLVSITGCGSVPGIGNVMLNYAANKFDEMHTIEVGFAWNSNIKQFVVPFSMASIIEEFTEPATNIKNGRFVKLRPMDSLQEWNDKFVGEEESFFVRHPETYTFYHYFKHKKLKNVNFYAEFPPHSFNVIKHLIDYGLGSKEDVMVDGKMVKPIDMVTELSKNIKAPKGYKEKEDLWVTIQGKSKGKMKVIKMQCVVDTLPGWEDAGCNIDTGMTASIMAQMIKEGTIKEGGSYAPEYIVPPVPFFKELAKRKMVVYENGKRIN